MVGQDQAPGGWSGQPLVPDPDQAWWLVRIRQSTGGWSGSGTSVVLDQPPVVDQDQALVVGPDQALEAGQDQGTGGWSGSALVPGPGSGTGPDCQDQTNHLSLVLIRHHPDQAPGGWS